jgi:ATP-GRASP peptide maturase of grasp-with-spasm system
MILIIGRNEIDMPSDLVFCWIKYLGASCFKLNGTDLLENQYAIYINKNSPSNEAKWKFKGIDVEKVTAVWMRRWISSESFDLNEKMDTSVFLELLKEQHSNGDQGKRSFTPLEVISMLKTEFISQRRNEFRAYSKYFFELLKDVPTLGNPFLSEKDPSKAHQIRIAQEVGLKTPDTIITNSKKNLKEFASRYDQIICKNIGEISSIYYYKLFITYTSVITPEFIEQLPDHFFLSLFQEAIDKEFEIRVFYLEGSLFSMAIFSDNDPQTKVDFRMYNGEKPNRTVPLKLPNDLEDKIVEFMKCVNLSTGSLDLIYSQTGEYYFLEVNPVGQFGMVSFPCNYNLEKLMAEYLIKLSHNDVQTRN